jgi:hypothetical protein
VVGHPALLAMSPAREKGQIVNEEQKAWVERIKAMIAQAESGAISYECLIDHLQYQLDTCPEP